MRTRFLFLLSLLICGSAFADMSLKIGVLDLVDAKVDYQADYALVSGSGLYEGHISHAHGRDRWEFATKAGQQVLLLRRDLDEAAILWPEKRWYMSASFSMMAALLGGLGTETLNARQAGIERVNGETLTRYHIDTGSFIGDIWRSEDGILVKAAGDVTYQGQPTKGTLVLSNVRRVKSDPSVFVRPEGYFGIPLKLGK